MVTIKIERLRELLTCDPATGICRWKARTMRNGKRFVKQAGKPAGHFGRAGYIHIRVDGALVPAHRIVWAIAHGAWPSAEIDHINGHRADNRIANLRLASRHEQGFNTAIRADNTSGAKGVWFDSRTNMWCAELVVRRNKVWLGRFNRMVDAVAAREAAAKANHGAFYCDGHRAASSRVQQPAATPR